MAITMYPWLRKSLLALLLTITAAGGFAVLLTVHQAVTPQFTDVVEHFQDGTTRETEFFLWHDHVPFPNVEVTFTLTLPSRWSARRFSVLVREVIDSITINGNDVLFRPDRGFDMTAFLQEGPNNVVVKMHARERSMIILDFLPSFFTVQRLLFFAFALLIAVSWALALTYVRVLPRLPRSSIVLLVLGTSLATLYLTATPMFVRGHDWWGHIGYIEHLRTFMTIPRVGTSWQAHQPPLGYVPYTFAYFFLSFFHLDSTHLYVFLQFVSLGMVIIMLSLGLLAIQRLPSGKLTTMLSSVFFVTCLPVLMLSSQISNDVLLSLFGIVWILLLTQIHSAKHPERVALGIGTVIGLGLLTKFNALPWLFITLVILPFMLPTSRSIWQCLWRVLFSSLILVAPLWGWRYGTHQILDPIANSQYQEGTMPLSVSFSQLFTFNPLDLLESPYIDFSRDSRATHFFETLFRKTLVLSSSQHQESAYIIILALLLIPFFLWSTFVLLRARKTAYLPMIVLLSFAALLLFRMLYPYSTAQHTRYIVYAFLPLAIMLSEGMRAIRPLFLRALGESILLLFSLVSTLTIIAVSVI